ncbi:MAG: MerR family transcriptional regulator [Flavobacteriaceae bacterium]
MHIELPEKRYYKIGEVAEAFSVNVSLIRFWEKEFDSVKPKKNAKGDRMFTTQDIEQIRLIHHLVKERGFTLDGAKKKMKKKPDDKVDHGEILVRLQDIRAELVKLKSFLD